MTEQEHPIAGPERELWQKMDSLTDEQVDIYYGYLRQMSPEQRIKWRRGTSILDLTKLRRAVRGRRKVVK